jgi:lipoprotein signal peptidase
VLGVLFFFFRGLATSGLPATIGLGLLLGGTLGNNIIDRLWHGYVTDFVDLNFWPLQEWPVFNIADSSIVIGVCILTLHLLLHGEQPAPAAARAVGRETAPGGDSPEGHGGSVGR